MDRVIFCDKCGEPVEPNNDAIVLELILTKRFGLLFASPRHLLPTDTCEGSPSRAQYIEGQPRDTRPEYPYDERLEVRVRKAYKEMQDMSDLNVAERVLKHDA